MEPSTDLNGQNPAATPATADNVDWQAQPVQPEVHHPDPAAKTPLNESALKNKVKNLPMPSKKVLKIAIPVLVGVLMIVLVFAYLNARKEVRELSNNPEQAAQAESEELRNQVAQLIELPAETPTIATVTDVEKLQDQPFFANAINGDKVLIFSEAKKAVLYRPTTNKIIEVAPIRIGDSETQQTPEAN